MNGRIYDDTIARFVQADPMIQDPYKTQSLNRYSYVWNNPLNATDPSGFACNTNDAQNDASKCQTDVKKEKDKEEKNDKKQLDRGGCDVNTCYYGADAAKAAGFDWEPSTVKLEKQKDGLSPSSTDAKAAKTGEQKPDTDQQGNTPRVVAASDANSTVTTRRTQGKYDEKLNALRQNALDRFDKVINGIENNSDSTMEKIERLFDVSRDDKDTIQKILDIAKQSKAALANATISEATVENLKADLSDKPDWSNIKEPELQQLIDIQKAKTAGMFVIPGVVNDVIYYDSAILDTIDDEWMTSLLVHESSHFAGTKEWYEEGPSYNTSDLWEYFAD